MTDLEQAKADFAAACDELRVTIRFVGERFLHDQQAAVTTYNSIAETLNDFRRRNKNVEIPEFKIFPTAKLSPAFEEKEHDEPDGEDPEDEDESGVDIDESEERSEHENYQIAHS